MEQRTTRYTRNDTRITYTTLVRARQPRRCLSAHDGAAPVDDQRVLLMVVGGPGKSSTTDRRECTTIVSAVPDHKNDERPARHNRVGDRKSTRLNSSH